MSRNDSSEKSKSAQRKMKLDIPKFLSTIFLFENLSLAEIKKIAEQVSIHYLKRQQVLFNEGQIADAFYIIVYGRLSITKVSKNGIERPLHYHRDREVVAEAAMFDLGKYPANCVSLQESMVIRIARDKFIGMLKEYPEMAIKMLAAYSKRLRGFVHMIEYLTLDGVKERLLKYILKHWVIEDNKEVERCIANVKLSKKELALILGTVPETLSRMLASLKKEGVLKELSSSPKSTLFEINYHKVKEMI